MLIIKDLTKKYGNHTAVDSLNLQIEDGHIYGFLGPNGAGKSTTMNMITGYIAPTSGEVIIDGIRMADSPEKVKKNIGYLPEIPPVYMDMTVNEYLRFASELKSVPKAERGGEIERVKEKLDLKDVEGRLIRNLSKGYRQRVGFAQAIMGNPKLLILDEPMVGLDPKQIIEIRDLIKELGKNHTIILSSHILSEISAVCDHIMIISHGKLVCEDSPENLISGKDKEVKLNILADGLPEVVLEAISPVCAGLSVEVNAEGDLTRISISSENDLRRDVFFALAGKSIPILEMTINKNSLEEIFLELTENSEESEEAEEAEESEETEEGEEENHESDI